MNNADWCYWDYPLIELKGKAIGIIGFGRIGQAEARIAKMKDGVIFINNARGQLIDKQDVADALNCGKMAAAGLDVVYTEPIRADNPLLKAKNCIITPHISWAPKVSRQRIMDTSAARCISTATFSLLCPNPRSKLWQKCSRRSTPKRVKRRHARKQKPLLPSCAP